MVVGNRTESGTEKEGRSRSNVFLFKLLNSLEAFDFAGGRRRDRRGWLQHEQKLFLIT